MYNTLSNHASMCRKSMTETTFTKGFHSVGSDFFIIVGHSLNVVVIKRTHEKMIRPLPIVMLEISCMLRILQNGKAVCRLLSGGMEELN